MLYCPVTGKIIWKNDSVGRGRPHLKGEECGCIDSNGYRYISVSVNGFYKRLLAHRLAWYIYYGVMPNKLIDHINGNRTDNRIENLREVTSGQNLRNRHNRKSKTGHTNIHKDRKSYRVQFWINGRNKTIFKSKDLEECVKKRDLFLNNNKRKIK